MTAARAIIAAAALAAMLGGADAFAHGKHEPKASPAETEIGALPPAGTYALERIMPAPDGRVLDTAGREAPLARYTSDMITVLSFVYTRCGDVCPLAVQVQREALDALQRDAGLRGKVRFVTLSFDPAYDTPKVMKEFAAHFVSPGDALPWHFLTTRSTREIAGLLEGFGQDLDESDDPALGPLSHVLKVFLIDPAREVREIYSTDFLTSEVLINDVKTLAAEKPTPAE